MCAHRERFAVWREVEVGMFRDECIVITGGSSGLGKLLARRCLDGGARVGLVARDTGKLDAARRELSTGDAARLGPRRAASKAKVAS
jgi:NADP-dependent 3-hydroxy acid dehydrogenase YdfG